MLSTPTRRRASSTPGRSTEATVIEQSYGDLDAAFRAAHAVVELDLASAATPACRWRRAARSRATMRRATCSSCTAPPRCRIATASSSPRCSARPRRRLHLLEGHVGGGFGIRGELYPEDVLVCVGGACGFGRPVKWIEDRHEHLVAANHSRQQRHRLRAAVDARRPHPRHRRRVLPRPGRLCAHPRRRAWPTSPPACCRAPTHAGLSSASATIRLTNKTPAGDLSRARPLREHVRARAAAGRDRASGSGIDRDRGAAAQPDRQVGDAVRRGARRARRRGRARFRRLCRAARQGARRVEWRDAAGRARSGAARRRTRRRRARLCSSRRAGSARSTTCDRCRCRRARSSSSPAALRSARASRP